MKKLSRILIISAGFILTLGSCKKYLDINTNPNASTSTTAELVLPQAMVYTATMLSAYNNYGIGVVGYASNGGGYGGFGVTWTYDYKTTDQAGLWSGSYDLLNDIQYVITSTASDPSKSVLNGVARILKAYNFQMLVDQYNSVPYFNALTGEKSLTPTYDDPKLIYQDLANQLDSAITLIDAGDASLLKSTVDPLFAGDITKWKQFANTIKLRLIVRASAAMSFTNTTFSTDGFLTDDAIVNPGYQLASGQVNPNWGSWVASYTGSAVGRFYIPSPYILAFYNGTKIADSARASVIYYDYPNTPNAQLGIALNVPNAPAVSGAWYSGPGVSAGGTALGNAQGVMKGPNMGEPLMLEAESYFLQAEADVRGILTGTAATDFNKGIFASFEYLYELPNLTASINPVTHHNDTTDVANYLADNAGNPLVDFSAATTEAQQIEAIITQKYIALNFINGQEAWNEYRRTGYPYSSPSVTNNATNSFASTQSQATRSDKLPTRLLYPNTELLYNNKSVPTGINAYTSLIFWAK